VGGNTMKKREILAFYNYIVEFANQNLPGAKWNYCLLKNINLLKPEITSIQEVHKKNAKYLEYETQRIVLMEKYCLKDDKGKPIVENGKYKFDDEPNSLKSLNTEAKELEDKYAEPIKEINDFLEERCEINLFKISVDDIPKELNAENINKLFEMIV
jgi:hypothetical protein